MDSQSKQKHLKERRSGVSHPGAPYLPGLCQPPWTAGPFGRKTLVGLPRVRIYVQPEQTSRPYPGPIVLTPYIRSAQSILPHGPLRSPQSILPHLRLPHGPLRLLHTILPHPRIPHDPLRSPQSILPHGPLKTP